MFSKATNFDVLDIPAIHTLYEIILPGTCIILVQVSYPGGKKEGKRKEKSPQYLSTFVLFPLGGYSRILARVLPVFKSIRMPWRQDLGESTRLIMSWRQDVRILVKTGSIYLTYHKNLNNWTVCYAAQNSLLWSGGKNTAKTRPLSPPSETEIKPKISRAY